MPEPEFALDCIMEQVSGNQERHGRPDVRVDLAMKAGNTAPTANPRTMVSGSAELFLRPMNNCCKEPEQIPANGVAESRAGNSGALGVTQLSACRQTTDVYFTRFPWYKTAEKGSVPFYPNVPQPADMDTDRMPLFPGQEQDDAGHLYRQPDSGSFFAELIMDPERKRFRAYLAVLLAVILLGAVGFSYFENRSFMDALYFVVVTIATVGYGDIHPTTTPGKLTAVLLIVTGVGTFLAVVANATDILLSRHEKRFRLQKQHVLLGIFFSEAGTELLRRFIGFDENINQLRQTMTFEAEWPEKQFTTLSQILDDYSYDVDSNKGNLDELRDFLKDRGTILLRLLESPYLLEHESFTELLRAVFHLREELLNRKDLDSLPQSDYQHLSGDIRRAYRLLARHWLEYLRHLKELFPYLFSLAVRMNPFDRNSSPVIK